MTREQWARVERLYHDAGSQPPGARVEWLSHECADDEVVRREVESLLAQNASTPDALDDGLQTPGRAHEDLTGRQIGGYTFLELIDEGGMGQVYRARDVALPRDVAVKVITPEFAGDPVRRARLRREAGILALLNHPHIAHVYTFVETEGRSLLVMELVSGETLASIVRRGPLPVADVLRYGAEIADALAEAHAAGIVHRDLKPGNVMVTSHGIKVLDFGLARHQTTALALSAATIAGTPAYMAPEQVLGGPVDARTDLFSLGLLLYEMTLGRLPVPGASLGSILAANQTASPGALSRVRADVTPALDALVSRLLLPDKAARPAATEARDELIRIASVPSRSRRTAGVVAATLALLILGGAGWWGRASVHEDKRLAGAQASVRSVAVLPLRNLTGADHEYFSDGITEELITALAQVRSLRVISRDSIMRYKDSRPPLPQIAKELGVDAVLQGSIQRDGDRVRVTTQLIDGRTDTHLWARAYDEPLANVLTLQAEIARTIAEQVRLRLSPQEAKRLSASRAVNPAAHDELLHGLAYRWRGLGDVPRALEHYDRALAIDPDYAEAYAGLALAWTLVSAPGSIAAARAAATRALELDPSLPEAHAALAAVKYRDWDWEEGHAESRLALEADPGALDGCYCFALSLGATGRLQEAITIADRAILSNPISGGAYLARGNAFIFLRKYDDAAADYRRGFELDPEFTWNRFALASVYDIMGRPQDAIALLEPIAQASSTESLVLASAYAHAGRRAEAVRLLERLTGAGQMPEATMLARVYLSLGDREKGLASLERSVQAREPLVHFILLPVYDSIRGEPRFRALVKELRMPDSFEAAEKAVGFPGLMTRR